MAPFKCTSIALQTAGEAQPNSRSALVSVLVLFAFTFALAAAVMAFFITFPHPLLLHKIDGLTAGVVASAILGLFFLMARWHIQINWSLVDGDRGLHDDDRLRINEARLWKAADVDAPINARLVDADGCTDVGLPACSMSRAC